MPVLDEIQVLEATDDRIAPKSILRHRPIGETAAPAGKNGSKTLATPPIAQRASRPRPADSDDDVVEWKRGTGNVDTQKIKKIQTPPPARRVTTATKSKELPKTPRPKIAPIRKEMTMQAHPLLYLGVGMVAMLVLWMVLSTIFGWFTTVANDIQYGRPRTFQTDAWVGHNEQTGSPSHFIAINLNKRIEIIEIAGGDAAHTRIYTGPQLYGAGDELTPVTLTFIDVNGDHKPDMVVNFQDSRVVFINDQGGFRPLLPTERPQVEQFLQHLGH